MRSRIVLLCALVFVECKSPTEISFVITTDVNCARVRDTAISVGTLGTLNKKPPAATSEVCTTGGKLGTLVVTPSAGRSDEVEVQIVTGLDGKRAEDCISGDLTGGCIVARRALRFSAHSALVVNIAMESSCRDVPCAGDQTCDKGRCVNAEVGACATGSCDLDAGAPQLPFRWRPMSKSVLSERVNPLAFWTGKEALFWGGDTPGGQRGDGAFYDPTLDTWRLIPPDILADRGSTAGVWTGAEMLVWGGAGLAIYADGARFDPAGSWTPLPASPLKARRAAVAVWATTTNEMIIWGGDAGMPNSSMSDGAAYSPSKRVWRMIAASPLGARTAMSAVWASGRMVVYSGAKLNTCDGCPDYASYDPSTDTWSAASPLDVANRRVWPLGVEGDGKAWFWGGQPRYFISQGDQFIANGAGLDPITGATEFIAAPVVSVLSAGGRSSVNGWFYDHKLWVFGGYMPASSRVATNDLVVYDTLTHDWTALTKTGAPTPRGDPTIVWTGREAIVWGGIDANTNSSFADGAVFGL